jgi:hypothetical protein
MQHRLSSFHCSGTGDSGCDRGLNYIMWFL